MAGAIVASAIGLKAGVTHYDVTWVSDASGNVSGSTFAMKQGTVVAVEFVPGSGALAPDTLYDVDMLDEHGVSIFDNGVGASIGLNLSATVASHAIPLLGVAGSTLHRRWHQGGPVQPTVANAGDSNAGTISVYVMDGVT